MAEVKTIYSKEDWSKVRELANKWYQKVDWWFPSSFFRLLWVAFGIIALFDHLNIKWVVAFLVSYTVLYGREQKVMGYLDGWNQAQDFILEDLTIDDLLNFDKQKKNKQKNEQD